MATTAYEVLGGARVDGASTADVAVIQQVAGVREQAVRSGMSFIEWAMQVKEAQTGFLDFGRYPYQKEPYETLGKGAHAVIEKGTQVGMSTLALRWALWVAGEQNGTVMYVFPVKDQVYKFSDQRVKPVIRASPMLRAKMRHDDPDNKGLKKVGAGYVYFVGSKSVTELDSVPANALVLDEFDELYQMNIPVVLRRVGAAINPMIRYIGVPTLNNYGIEAEFHKTDMRRWHVRCGGCGERLPLTWDSIRYEELGLEEYKAWRICRACGKDVEAEVNKGEGEWVPEFPDRKRVGFHVPRLIVPNANLGEVVRGRLSDKEEEKAAHYNRDLAEPFETPESRLSPLAIESCKRPEIKLVESYVGSNWVTAGIDVSSTRGLHVRVSEHLWEQRVKRVLWVGVVDAEVGADPNEPDRSALYRLARIMADYKVHMACIDHLPDGLFARAFCAAHPGRAYMVAYNTDYRATGLKVPVAEKPADLLVSAPRTEWITATLDQFRRQRNLLPLHEPLPKGVEGKTYEEHLRNVVKKRQRDTVGREYYGYEQTGPDDFLHAEVYDAVAHEVLRLRVTTRGLAAQLQAEPEIRPEDPTPDLSAWDGRPLGEEASVPESTYGAGWDEDAGDDPFGYRP